MRGDIDIIEEMSRISGENLEKEKHIVYGKGQSAAEMLSFLADSGLNLTKMPYKQQCEHVTRSLLTRIAAGQDIPGAMYALVHMYFAQLSLEQYGVKDAVSIYYCTDPSPKTAYAEFSYDDRFYNSKETPSNNVVTFYMDRSFAECMKDMLYAQYGGTVRYPVDRMDRFWREVKVIYHEATHAWQQKQVDKYASGSQVLPAEVFIMDKMDFAREIRNMVGEELIYTDNHDEFMCEMQANLYGGLYAMMELRRIATHNDEHREERMGALLPVEAVAYEECEQIWKHMKLYKNVELTSENNPGGHPVRAEFKAATIIEKYVNYNNGVLPIKYRDEHPSCRYMYDKHGRKKGLKELKRDKDALISKNPNLRAEVESLYDAIINGDPQLRLEQCAQMIEGVDWQKLPKDKECQRSVYQAISDAEKIVSSVESVHYEPIDRTLQDIGATLVNLESKYIAEKRVSTKDLSISSVLGLDEIAQAVKKSINKARVAVRDYIADRKEISRPKQKDKIFASYDREIMRAKAKARKSQDRKLDEAFENSDTGLRYVMQKLRGAIEKFHNNPEIEREELRSHK